MIELRVLGPVHMAGPADAVVEAVVVQPKRLALLGYLVLSPEPLVSREQLLALFWPESDERRAREALRQALRFLRRSLGPDVLVTRGRNWVGVDRGRITCDAWRFEALLSSGDAAGAVALYGGELLRGLEVRGLPAFEQWLAEARRELARLASVAAWSVAEAARDAGDAEGAISAAWHAREIMPADEEGVRRLIGIYMWAGDRAAALRAYDEFEAWLLAEFGAVPSLRTRELAARARGVAERGAAAAPTAGPGVAEGSWPGAGAPGVDRLRPTPRSGALAPSARWLRAVLAGAVVAVALTAVAFTSSWLAVSGRTAGAVAAMGEREVAVVVPFRVQEADVSLSFLRHGMAELLGAVFTGDVGPRAVPAPRRDGGRVGVVDRSSPEALARRGGGRWVIQGEVMGNDRDVRLSGSLRPVGGGPLVSAAVSGPADSIYGLARELGARLLVMNQGVREEDAARMARTTPPALHAYLLGRRALRQTHYEEADRRFHEALRHDSLYAPAAVGLVETHLAAPWVRGHVFELALPLALRLQDRLGAADREFIAAAAGPRYPQRSSHAEYHRAWERAVAKAPDRPAVWFQWGDALFHVGPFIGLPNHRERSVAALEHALALDPEYLLPLPHLIEMAADAGDSRRATELLHRYLGGTGDREPVEGDYLRWLVATTAGDTATLAALGARFHEMSVASLTAILRSASFLGRGLADADRIAALDYNRWKVPSERWNLLVRLHTHALNRGRPSVARALTDAMHDVSPSAGEDLHLHIRSALVAGGDVAAAREAAAQLEAHVELGSVSEQARRPGLVADICTLEVWKLNQGDGSSARQAIAWLKDPAFHDAPEDAGRERCAVFLEALLVRLERPHRVDEAVGRIGVLADQGVQLPGAGFEAVWLFLAQALEERGDAEGALRVVRRRAGSPFMLPTQLRLEGRLATLVGDTAGACRAYARYLALREDPEPSLLEEVLEVRRAYEALRGTIPATAAP
jgi:DNA-binding SARP family transcriptional activator/tetratricopeptide (TPR) repeat protein